MFIHSMHQDMAMINPMANEIVKSRTEYHPATVSGDSKCIHPDWSADLSIYAMRKRGSAFRYSP